MSVGRCIGAKYTEVLSLVPSDGAVGSAPKDGFKSDWGRMQVRVPVGLDDGLRKGLESPQAGS